MVPTAIAQTRKEDVRREPPSSNGVESGYLQKIRDLSFDMQMMHEYPAEWNTFNSAVPIMSKVKVIPALPTQSGQFFTKKPLATPAWDVTYQVAIEQTQALRDAKLSELVDLFACWYLLHEQKIRQGAHNSEKAFGFRDSWGGVGVFVYKEGENVKISAVESMGNDKVTLQYISKNFLEGVNGCTIPRKDFESLENRMVIHMRMDQSMLTISYGTKMRQSSHTNCLEKLYMPNLSSSGTLGITARNDGRNIKGIDVSFAKIMNMDPRFYTNMDDPASVANANIDNYEVTGEENSKHIYTDEMKLDHDLIEEFEIE